LLLLVAFVAGATARLVLTPFGYRPHNCVKEGPSGTVLKETATGVEAHFPNGTSAFHPAEQNCLDFQADFVRKKFAAHEVSNPQGPLANGWLDNAGYYPPKEVDVFSGTYSIPPDPSTKSDQVLFYFIGTENFQNLLESQFSNRC